jgi:hypothetical protein
MMLGNAGSCRPKEGAVMKPPVQGNEKLPTGMWGGQHIRTEVTDKGASLEFDCAGGTIDAPIVLDGKGNFDIKGKFVAEHAGPVRREGDENSRAVRYVGSLKNGELTLKVSDAKTKEDLGTFTLTHGSDGRVRKCR